MTEQNIIQLFQQKRQCEAELSIIRDCSDELHDAASADQAMHFSLLKRRMALVDHWLNYLSPEERNIVQLHLIQNKPWSYIVNRIEIGLKWNPMVRSLVMNGHCSANRPGQFKIFAL